MLELVIIVFIPDRDQNRHRKVLTEDQEDQLIPSKAEIGDTPQSRVLRQPYGTTAVSSLTS